MKNYAKLQWEEAYMISLKVRNRKKSRKRRWLRRNKCWEWENWFCFRIGIDMFISLRISQIYRILWGKQELREVWDGLKDRNWWKYTKGISAIYQIEWKFYGEEWLKRKTIQIIINWYIIIIIKTNKIIIKNTVSQKHNTIEPYKD